MNRAEQSGDLSPRDKHGLLPFPSSSDSPYVWVIIQKLVDAVSLHWSADKPCSFRSLTMDPWVEGPVHMGADMCWVSGPSIG